MFALMSVSCLASSFLSVPSSLFWKRNVGSIEIVFFFIFNFYKGSEMFLSFGRYYSLRLLNNTGVVGSMELNGDELNAP